MQPCSADDTAKSRGHLESSRSYTSLRRKTLLIVCATLLALVAILYIPLRIFLLGSFIELEEQMLLTDLNRASSAIADDIHDLDLLNASYAIWDDSYTFVDTPNQNYIDNNYYDDFFIDNRLNLVLITDNSGRIVFGKGFDLVSGHEDALPQRFQQLVANDILLGHSATTSIVTGVVSLPSSPMLISSRPIVTSLEQGPARGTLIFGRSLDAREIGNLAAITHLKMTVERQASRRNSQDPAAPVVQVLGEQTIATSQRLPDLDAISDLSLRVEVPRSIYAQGLIGINSFLLSLVVAGLILGGIMISLLERFVLSRLIALQANVQQIGAQSDLAKRIEATGDDELASLAESINGMLAALEQAQAERQQAEEVRRQLQLRDEALRAKREMLSVVSHELRTPLTPMLGYVDLMLIGEGGELTNDQRMLLNTIRSNTLRMSVLVEDLLEIGRLETQTLALQFVLIDLHSLISETVDLLRPEIERKHLTLTQEIAAQLPAVEADQKRVGQVLMNLLTNALKYSDAGGRLSIRVFQHDSQYIEVQVEDTGVGLTPEQQSQLFTRFYRADNPFRDRVSGSGLGLAIAKGFVELHGGSISV
ncbi:MAG TPA: CHASE4 domain-containing protein, partial [Roseiflexaceae bacterium]|nr:CHASE4 domain-containing protein [Roseiflexaceae bacterium]